MERNVIMFSTSWCGDCKRTERILVEKGVSFRKIDIDTDESAAERVMLLAGGKRVVPTLVVKDVSGEKVLVNPSPLELAREFGFAL